MKRIEIQQLYNDPAQFGGQTITVGGWCRTIRSSNAFGCIELNDGSAFKNLQVVIEADKLENYKNIAKQNVGASFVVTGGLVLTPEAKQPFELKAQSVEVEGTSTPDYPMQKKGQSLEFLRTKPHLRPRTNLFNAVFKVRSKAAQLLHQFFAENGFVYVHTPLITTNDCEGAGDMFRVTIRLLLPIWRRRWWWRLWRKRRRRLCVHHFCPRQSRNRWRWRRLRR